jgi:hypothetical protein
MKHVFLALGLVLLPSLCSADDPQSRIVLHTTADVSDKWFITNWTIGNIKSTSPNDINVFPGIGYRSSNWWFESMVQRQWSKSGDSWALDFRYSVNLNDRISFYAESAPLLTTTGEYEFVSMDFRVFKQFAIGFETENIHQPGPDVLDIGPRVSLPLVSIGEYKLSLSATYQIHYQSADIPRLYVVLNRRFKR